MMTDREAYEYMANEARNDTRDYEQAMLELSGGRKFAAMPSLDQRAVIRRAQELKRDRAQMGSTHDGRDLTQQ